MCEGGAIRWCDAEGLEDMMSAGCFVVQLRHGGENKELPLGYCSDEHYIVATLIVTESGTDDTLQKNRTVGQTLVLPQCGGDNVAIYARSYRFIDKEYAWSQWSMTQQDTKVGLVTSFDGFTSNGLYSGVYSVAGSSAETFVLTVIDNNVAATVAGKVKSISQFKYSLNLDGTFSYRVRTGQGNNSISWGNWVDIGAADTTDIQDNSITAQKLSIDVREKVAAVDGVRNKAIRIDTLQVVQNAEKVSFDAKSIDESNSLALDVPTATNEKAGVMSAEDKNLLNNSAQGKDVPMLLRTNYYDPNDEDFVTGAYLDSNGDFLTNDGYCITGYIPLNSVIGRLLCTRNGEIDTLNGGFIGFYTEDKQPLFFKQVAANNGLAEWEDKVAYVRFSIRGYYAGHIQIENGCEYTTEIVYGKSIWNGDFPINTIEPKNLSQIFGVEKTPNLINHAELQRDIVAYIRDGELEYTASPGLCVSGLIEVKPLTTYTFWYSGNYFFLDADRKVIGDKNAQTGTVSAMTPENCRYMVINFYYERSGFALYDLDATARMYEGDVLYPYIPYGVATDRIQTYMLQQILSSMGNKAARFPRSSVDAQGIAKTSDVKFPYSIKDNQIAFSGNFDAFETLVIGRGVTNNAYSGCRFEINEMSVELFKNDGGWIKQASVEHGLMMNSYIKVLISERKSKVLVSIQTLAGSFEHEFDYWGANGQIAAKPSMPMTDTILSVSNPAFKCPVWMFGDSYYGADYESRQMYWLRRWGYDNALMQAFGGQGSNDAYNDLLRCLDFGTPRFLVWSLGMNDDNGNDLSDIKTGVWYTTYQKVRKICEVMNIELILTTIPEVKSSSYKNKDKMSEVIRSSGLRYIDAAKAVGSNANGEWYGNGTEYDYQSSDNVHPSKYGAKAIANQFLIDFPEIMQY